MSKHKFTPQEQHAVYTVHGEKCYLCGAVLTLKTMEVDHVIPESLLNDPARLATVLTSLGRPPRFALNSFENWLPTCRPCNGKKLAKVFEPAPIILILLQDAAAKAPKARAVHDKAVQDRDIHEAMNVLERANEIGLLDEEHKAAIRPLVEFHMLVREPELLGQPMLLTPLYRVLSETNGLRLVEGPFGTGGGPISPSDAMRCPNCGFSAWNGARCVVCGEMSDD